MRNDIAAPRTDSMMMQSESIPSPTGAKSLSSVDAKYALTFEFASTVPQGPAENRSDPGGPSEEDSQQYPVHEGANEPVTHHFGMTTGGAVPRNGQHSWEQQQWEPPNDPRSIGPRQSRDYRLNLVHYSDKRRPGSTPTHPYQPSHRFMQNCTPGVQGLTEYCFSVYS